MHVLVIRFSAMGDVALSAPVIQSALNQNPNLKITLVSRKLFQAFFPNQLERFQFVDVDFKKRHKGLPGLFRLARELNKMGPFDAVLDIHSVLRTQILRFFLTGKIYSIDKGRGEKKQLLQTKSEQLKHTVERYADVFRQAGLNLKVERAPSLHIDEQSDKHAKHFLNARNALVKPLIGIAPFSKHFTKTWPLEKMKKVVQDLTASDHYHILFFGGSPEEIKTFEEWENSFPHCSNTAGKLSFAEEISLIRHLSVMLSMDSANMHLAALSGVPVVSLWGGTHPYAGFGPFNSAPERTIQKTVDCRPCSVFGRSDCPNRHFHCMYNILPDEVTTAVKELAGGSNP